MRSFIGIIALLVCAVQVLISVPDPYVPVIPPEVVIPPEIVVPPEVVTTGKRVIAILYESLDSSDTFARTTVELQDANRDFAKYLASKGHTLYILDDDTVNSDNQLADFVSGLLSVNSTLPCMYVLDAADGKPLDDQAITFDVTQAQIMAFLKANGG